jgi:hypothetical protein
MRVVNLLLASFFFVSAGATASEPVIRPIHPEAPEEEWTQERCERSASPTDDTRRNACYGLKSSNMRVLRMCARFPIDFNKACDGDIPIHIAAGSGHEEAVELLLGTGANPLQRNFANATALHAILGPGYGKNRDNHRRLVRRFVGLGLSPNDKGTKAFTPFTLALFLGDEQMVELLLELGANVNQPDERGRMPLDVADDYKNPKKIALLEQRGAKRSGIPREPRKGPLDSLGSGFVGRH